MRFIGRNKNLFNSFVHLKSLKASEKQQIFAVFYAGWDVDVVDSTKHVFKLSTKSWKKK